MTLPLTFDVARSVVLSFRRQLSVPVEHESGHFPESRVHLPYARNAVLELVQSKVKVAILDHQITSDSSTVNSHRSLTRITANELRYQYL